MSSGPCWLAHLRDRPEGSHAIAAVRCLDAGSESYLAAWTGDSRPHPDARRVDPAAVDPDGPAAAVSLGWPVAGRRPLFDDPSVVQAIRRVAWVPHLTCVTTLTADAVHCAGSLLASDPAVAAAWPGWWSLDPFVRLGPRRRLLVGAGLLADRVAVLGPGTQRHAGALWPAPWPPPTNRARRPTARSVLSGPA